MANLPTFSSAPLAAGTSAAGALTAVGAGISSIAGLILASPQVGATKGYQAQNSPYVGNNINQTSVQPSLIFHYEGEQTALMESDITDHFVENNSSIQDQVSLRPEIVTTHGFVGELNNVPPTIGGFNFASVQAIANTLGTINAYTPVLSVAAQIAYNEAFFLYQTANSAINSATSVVGSLTGSNQESVIGNSGIIKNSASASQNVQQFYFNQFYGYWSARQLFTVQTPWGVFTNMAIKTLKPVQDADTNVITDFQVVFKKLRFATLSATAPPTAGVTTGRLSPQVQQGNPVQLGTSNLQAVATPTQAQAIASV